MPKLSPAVILLPLTLALAGCGLELGFPVGQNAVSNGTTGKRIFVTNATVTGLIAGSAAIAAADSLCNNDSNRPSTTTSFKALISDGTTRSGTLNNQIDWPLRANQLYVRNDLTTTIGTSSASATLFPTGAVGTQGYTVWTGLNTDYSAGEDCTGFRTDASGYTGRVGRDTATGISAVSVAVAICNTANHLYCVEL